MWKRFCLRSSRWCHCPYRDDVYYSTQNPRQCNDDVIVCVCVCVCGARHSFERRLRECVMMSALRQQLYPSLWRWQLFSPVADSTGAMDRFACCSTRTGRCGVRYRALQCSTSLTVCVCLFVCLFVCLLTDACEKGLRPPPCSVAVPSAVPSALLSLHLYRTPRIQCRLGSFL